MPRLNCSRCGDLCRGSASEKSDARPFRKAAKRGRCTPCAVVAFFRGDEKTGIGFALPPDFDPKSLLLPHIQALFARVLAVGGSELKMEEIDWDKVIEKWTIKP
jgi:hypothetical protein